MPVKIRLQRHGKKGQPFYHIVAADSRSKRDGRYIEKLGIYNPNTNPAIIDLNVDGAVNWLQNGAQPTDTARAILSYKGAMLKNHLLNGVRKGALSEDQVEAKFKAWLEEKEGKISAKADKIAKDKAAADKKALAAEAETNAARAKAIEAKNTPEVEEEAPAAEEAETTEEVVAEAEAATEEAPQAEETVEEEPVAEAETEEVAEETQAEEPVAEVKEEEAPAAEETSEEEEKAAE